VGRGRSSFSRGANSTLEKSGLAACEEEPRRAQELNRQHFDVPNTYAAHIGLNEHAACRKHEAPLCQRNSCFNSSYLNFPRCIIDRDLKPDEVFGIAGINFSQGDVVRAASCLPVIFG
jgi:hypothetical protein